MTISRSDWIRSVPVTEPNQKANTPVYPFLARLVRGEDLSARDAAAMFSAMTSGQCGSNQIAATLAALTAKGETHEELAGMASVMRSLATQIRAPRNAVDIAGTGGSATRTFSVSTAAALVAAGAGLAVAKQCNRSSTTRSGSIEVLSELGIKAAVEPQTAEACLGGVSLGFVAMPHFFPALRRVADVRSALGLRTCINFLGLMANPASPTRHVIGVWHRSLVEPVARALAMLKTESAWVVHGSDGLDEITTAGETLVGVVRRGSAVSKVVGPADFGLRPGKTVHLRAANAKENASIIREVLSSQRRDEARSLVVMNAAAALLVGGVAKDLMQAARLAERSIDSGMAQNKLERLAEVSRKRQ